MRISALRSIASLLFAAFAVTAQDTPKPATIREDPWAKVQALKSGAELRIIRKDSRQPVLAVYEDLNDDALIIATKKGELGIPKDQIERIDARPAAPAARLSKENRTTTTTDPALGPPTQRSSPVPTSTSSSSSVSFGGKPDFQTIYRATSASAGK